MVPGVVMDSGVSPVMALGVAPVDALGVSSMDVPVVSDASGVTPGGLSVLIVGVVMTPLTSVGVEPAPGTIVVVVVVVVGVASGPQAASRSVPITRNDVMPVNFFFSIFR